MPAAGRLERLQRTARSRSGTASTVTPLQMAAVYAAIANDGMWIQPHLVGRPSRRTARARPRRRRRRRRVISAEKAAALRTMLEAVVTVQGATGRRPRSPGYRVAGKTGTGERWSTGSTPTARSPRSSAWRRPTHPRYVIAVFAHTPHGGGGADVAGPAFSDMMAFTLRTTGWRRPAPSRRSS